MIPYISEEQQTIHIPDTEQFIRNTGPYKIADIVTNQINTSSPGQLCGRKIAVISGAGIAGLAAAFELHAKEYDVVISEMRSDFSRFNILNLNKEVQSFLREFGLLEEFEESVAARIQDHKIVTCNDETCTLINTHDVSQLQFEGTLETDPKKFKKLFKEPGIYSAQIKDLQAFLAQKAAKIGVKILSDSTIKFVDPIDKGRITKVEIQQKNKPLLTLEPDLVFIAEGAHSKSAKDLGMTNDDIDVIEDGCSDENWVFGNVEYHGDKTFVISMDISTEKSLQIANVIFNAKTKSANVAVTSDEYLMQDDINRLIMTTAQRAFDLAGITETPSLIETVQKPVRTTNRIASVCLQGNVFLIGDAAGHSSPLATLGGTIALTLVPCTIKQLLEDLQCEPEEANNNFEKFTQAYVKKWVDKSTKVMKAIQKRKDKQQMEACYAPFAPAIMNITSS